MREYVVGLKEGVDYDAFWTEIETDGSGSTYVPSRAVGIVDARPVMLRSCVYSLNDNEVEKLRNDSRVDYVEIPIEQTEHKVSKVSSQTGLYYKSAGVNPANNLGINWGLFRLNSTTNNTTGSSGTLTYNYPLDGTGVDFVIMDSGIQADHPDFNNYNGTSRVQKINWFTQSGVSGTQPADNLFYADTDGHGTHCAGIAAGLTYGRAKNSNIFSILLNDLAGPGTTGISISQAFQVLKGWHINKNTPGNPYYTGRPTVVNMSFGYGGLTFANFSSITYQGVTTVTSVKDPTKGMIGNIYNQFPWYTSLLADVRTAVSECISAGVVFCGAAGNSSQTTDVPDGVNYNNYFTSTAGYGNVYYMQGMTPAMVPGVINVGNVSTIADTPEEKSGSSESGPRVDVWAPGTNIVSTTSNINDEGATATYPPNPSYKIMSISGTSMASPQVAGIAAQLLQVYPTATPAQIRQKIIDTSTANMLFTTGLSTDYANTRSLHGGPNRYAYQPFNTATNSSVTGAVAFNNTSLGT